MREEQVTLSIIDAEKLMKSAKDYLEKLGLKIINEDVFEGYHSIKAHKGGKLALGTGSIRDVELLITGTDKNYELTLRTGAWGRDVVIPALIGSAIVGVGTAARTSTAVTAGAAVTAGVAVAVVQAYRAGKFEKNFWTWLNKEIVELEKEATMSKPQVVVPKTNQ
jgi:hypothetical protein